MHTTFCIADDARKKYYLVSRARSGSRIRWVVLTELSNVQLTMNSMRFSRKKMYINISDLQINRLDLTRNEAHEDMYLANHDDGNKILHSRGSKKRRTTKDQKK